MADYRRLYVPGGTVFFTVNLADRHRRTLTDHLPALRAAYAYTARRHPFTTVAICVLPDHLHAVWTLPAGDADFSTRWRLIKTMFTRALPNAPKGRRPGERAVWQRRFWEHQVRDERDLANHVAYTHWNPVKHGLVRDMDDWAPSTWHRYKDEFGRAWKQPAEMIVGEP